MNPQRIFVFLLIMTLISLPLWSQLTTGPKSPYYIASRGRIYVVQGTNPVWSFPTVYGGDESVFAIPCTSPSPCTSVLGQSTIYTRTDGFGPGTNDGEYTLSGTPTGVQYVTQAGTGTVYDGTSDGSFNYGAMHFGGVFVADLHWQNESLLFDQTLIERPTGITYDPYNNSLWLSDGPTATVADFSLGGVLLRSFDTFDMGNTALAFDSADDTLWMVKPFHASPCPAPAYQCMMLQQWSTGGRFLQGGVVDGLPDYFWTSGEMPQQPAPEPATIILFGSGAIGLAGLVRRNLQQ